MHTLSFITHSSYLVLITPLLHNLHAAVAMQAGTHTEQCTEQCLCVCVFVSTLWCMYRDRGEAINECSVLATSCFPVNMAVSVHECVWQTILPNCFSSQEIVECHSFYHPPPILQSVYLKSWTPSSSLSHSFFFSISPFVWCLCILVIWSDGWSVREEDKET